MTANPPPAAAVGAKSTSTHAATGKAVAAKPFEESPSLESLPSMYDTGGMSDFSSSSNHGSPALPPTRDGEMMHMANGLQGLSLHQSTTTTTTTADGHIHGQLSSAPPSGGTTASVPPASKKKTSHNAHILKSGDFESESHFYPRVLNAQIHPLVASFFALGNERIIARYVHLNPQVNEDKLREVLAYKPRYFSWAGKSTGPLERGEGNRSSFLQTFPFPRIPSSLVNTALANRSHVNFSHAYMRIPYRSLVKVVTCSTSRI